MPSQLRLRRVSYTIPIFAALLTIPANHWPGEAVQQPSRTRPAATPSAAVQPVLTESEQPAKQRFDIDPPTAKIPSAVSSEPPQPPAASAAVSLEPPQPPADSAPPTLDLTPGGELGTTVPDSVGDRTAVYDISAQTVFLPNGRTLEAHSGLGKFKDDPGSAAEKNKGVTPPNVYKLALREQRFHGVQALRLTPASEDGMHGRNGILAHTYMLGPQGQSNGCVVFKDYDPFLQAFLSGDVNRLVVVTSMATLQVGPRVAGG